MSAVKPPDMSPVSAACPEPEPVPGAENRLTVRFCEVNLKDQDMAVRIRRALETAPDSFKARLRLVTVRCADRCQECGRGPLVVVDHDAIAPATLRRVVEEITRRVAPEKLTKKQRQAARAEAAEEKDEPLPEEP
ncbi:MAG: hypothetical protein ACM3ZA_12845 [Bacillota bacterium]